MQTEFIFAGFGGQGVMFAGQLLAYAAMDAGLNVTWIPSYGPEMRGGTANCTVVISDKVIGAPVVSRPAVVLAFNRPSFDKYEPLVKSGGLLLWNSSIIDRGSDRTDIALRPVPASEIADSLGSLKTMNIVMLGAALAASPVLSLDVLEQALREHLPAHRQDLLQINLDSLYAGAEAVQAALR